MTQSTTRSLRRAFLCLTAVFAPLTLPAATINVPVQQKTIQAGIDASSDGDTVLVAPGTYYENIDFKGKAITVTSSGGAAVTTIDGGNKPGVATVLFANGETSASVISKLTIRGGGDALVSGGSGVGGIYVNQASPTIQNNTVTANYCYNIGVEFGTATISGNEISGVLQSQGQSYCFYGGGIFLGGTPDSLTGLGSVVEGNTIENNLAGSGISMWAAQNVLIMNNIIRGNISPEPGSAFTSANSTRTAIVQNIIYGNTSTCGGALAFQDGNSSTVYYSILIANNTIVDNVTPKATGGSECTPIAQIYPGPYSYGSSGPDAVIVNNVVSGSTSYPAVNCSFYEPPSETIQPTFQNNILFNGGGPFFGSYCVDVSSKYNNIASDPQFVSPSTGDYRLKRTSPAIDSGQNSVVQTFLALTGQNFTTDFDGNPRLQDANGQGCTIDMGAFESPGTTTDCSSTTVALTSSLNPSLLDQKVTFTAQLSSSNGTTTGDVQFIDGTTILGTVALSSTGSAALSTSQLSVGSHTITADYLQSGSAVAAKSTLTQVVNGYPTTATLASSLNPATVGQSVTITATVTSTNGTPTGLITFTDGATNLGVQTLVSGAATFTTSTLAIGTHPITASYSPTGTFNASNSTLSQVINGLATSTSLSVAPTTATYGTGVVMTSTVNLSGSPNSTGGLSFLDGTTVIATGELLPGSSTSSFTDAYLAVGTHTITAVYSGDATHNGSTSAPVVVTITATPTTLGLSVTPNPGFALQPITLTAKLAGIPTGSAAGNPISFLANGTYIGAATTDTQGKATLTTTFSTGNYTLSAAFAGSASLGASTSAPAAEVVNPNSTSTAVYAQPNPGYQGGNETLTATVTTLFSSTTTPPIPVGTVALFDDGVLFSTANLDVHGQATFSTSTLTIGSHSIIATYLGTPNFLNSTSSPYILNILPRDFTLATDPTITIQTQHHKDLNLTLASIGDFTDTVALSCANLPAYATCTFPNNGLMLAAGASKASSVHVDTDALLNYISSNDPASPPQSRPRSGIAYGLLLPVTLMAIMRRRRKLPRIMGLCIGLSVGLIAMTFAGCSARYPGHTRPGTYTFTVTGQGVATHISHTATVTLIVTE